MRIFILTSITMLAFAANSVLNRMALSWGSIDASSFGTIRLFAGAIALVVLCLTLRKGMRFWGPRRAIGVFSLLLYIYGFSSAYTVLDAGIGALILFGMVQITMFAGGLWTSEVVPTRRWIGAGLAFAGLAWLLWPGMGAQISLLHGGLMVAAGIGWGFYSLAGRGAGDALMETAGNFALAAPIGFVLGLFLPIAPGGLQIETSGVMLAVLSGAVTSGLGYALWYHVLPKLQASVAAVAQLTVPLIAMAGGMVFLAEPLTLSFVITAVLVLGGVALSISR